MLLFVNSFHFIILVEFLSHMLTVHLPPFSYIFLVANSPFFLFVPFEFQRIGDSLDFEIKRWSAGKEGNLRALLSTLQYVSC